MLDFRFIYIYSTVKNKAIVNIGFCPGSAYDGSFWTYMYALWVACVRPLSGIIKGGSSIFTFGGHSEARVLLRGASHRKKNLSVICSIFSFWHKTTVSLNFHPKCPVTLTKNFIWGGGNEGPDFCLGGVAYMAPLPPPSLMHQQFGTVWIFLFLGYLADRQTQ